MDGRDYKNDEIAFNTLKIYNDIDFSKLESPSQHFFRLSTFYYCRIVKDFPDVNAENWDHYQQLAKWCYINLISKNT